MRASLVWLLLGAFLAPAFQSQTPDAPAIDGYVTRAASSSDFDVDGVRVFCSGVEYLPPGTVRSGVKPPVSCPAQTPFLGEHLAIYGAEDAQGRSAYATRIEIRLPKQGFLFGSAVIDAIPPQETSVAPPLELLVRADGRWICLTSRTKIEWAPPLRSLADVKAGDWIQYKGRPDASGVLIAESVRIGPNEIGNDEEKLRAKNEYDPASVPADAKQNLLKDAFDMGYDPKQFSPYEDAAMQARIDKIGESLVPAYQRALPDSGTAKTHFRFHLVDNKHFCGTMPCDVFALSSAIILVPHQVVERMQNDSQLAAVLADAIARVMEKQDFRMQFKRKAAVVAGMAGAFVPYAGFMIATEGMSVEGNILLREQHQSGRVSLDLLHDAGYDIAQAPVAWWLLSSRKPQPISEIDMPDRAGYLYRILGEVWRNQPTAAAQSN